MILNKDFRNSEYYADPTACIAIANVMRETRGFPDFPPELFRNDCSDEETKQAYAGNQLTGSYIGKKRNQEQENWEDFSNRIILQAVDDYRKARQERRKFWETTVKRERTEKAIREIEAFFLSDWFMQMTNLDGEKILKRLQKEDL